MPIGKHNARSVGYKRRLGSKLARHKKTRGVKGGTPPPDCKHNARVMGFIRDSTKHTCSALGKPALRALRGQNTRNVKDYQWPLNSRSSR